MTSTRLTQTLLWGRYRLAPARVSGPAFSLHRGYDVVLQRDVVVKCSHYPAGSSSELARERDAARRVAALAHHGLVPLLDIGLEQLADGGTDLGLVFEHVDGRTLGRALAESGPLTVQQTAYLGFDLAEALEYLHTRGVVARAVSETNIVLAEQSEGRPQARLLDLSGAVAAGTVLGPASLDRPGRTTGTASSADDVRALGAVLVAALTGAAAPGGTPEVPAGTPDALAAVLASTLSADPAARPTSTELAVAFRELVALEFGRHRRVAAAPSVDADEEARLEALHRYDLLDTPPEGAFDRITGIASRSLGMPVSTVSIVDRDRIWFKSHHGVDAEQIGRDPGLCAAVVSSGRRLVVPDARADESTRHNPLIAGEMGLQSYVGVPLTSADGYTLGALSVADYEPRHLTAEQLAVLDDLGTMVTHELEMRLAARRAVLSRD